MNRLMTTALLAVFAIGSVAIAQDDDRAAMAKEQLQQTVERLELSDEQIEQVRPVLEESAAARQEILSKYGIDLENPDNRPPPRKLMSMRKEMNAVRKDTMGQLEQYLSDEQLAELKTIQEERQAEMRERMRGGK